MEKVEIAIRILGLTYALAILILIIQLQNEDINYIMLITVYTMVFTCPCLWALIRFCRAWVARRRMIVLPDRKPKKKPDIAVPKGKAVQRTQAEILAEQRARVQKLHGVGDGKKKPKSPKRKGPPIKNA
uniref:Uncharacterized protein n=1 Tax=Globisporangium ultimum (strain ATCC 200006 / CBS 805.95 / DAOM BR144) TaxID=431595 RepID=K3WYC8_GLOUD